MKLPRLILPFVFAVSVFNSQADERSLSPSGSAETIGFSVIHTAKSAGAQEAMVVSSGSWWTRRQLVQTAVLIQHPNGDVMIDTGLGINIDKQFEDNGFLDSQLFKYEELYPAATQFKDNEYDWTRLNRIVPTHLHWDHASGLEDFPDIPVWVQEREYEEATHGKPPAHLPSQFASSRIAWHFFEMSDQPYAGFAKSLDIYGDGSIVLVDLSGHSAGQVGIFLTVSSGKRYFFIGDTTWTLKGVEDNASRPGFLNWMVKIDYNEAQNSSQIENIHDLKVRDDRVTIVPAHDEIVMAKLPRYPDFEF
ncbi:MAG: MBL fold metallo-hydrolase [Pseudomonadales bacterium]|nr:MBL fold metallo-hydrolase [Pseudomonadales bacterium]